MNWGSITLGKNQETAVPVADNVFLLSLYDNILSIAKQQEDTDQKAVQTITVQPGADIQVLPSCPSKPLIIKGVPDLKLHPGASVAAYITVPLTVKIVGISGEKTTVLWECDSRTLSQAWIGEPDQGTLGFSLFDRFILGKNYPATHEWEITCPIELINNSKEDFSPSKLFIDTRLVDIYQTPNGLVSDTIALAYTDSDNPFNATVHKPNGADFKRVGLASDPSVSTFYKRSFNFFKAIVQSR